MTGIETVRVADRRANKRLDWKAFIAAITIFLGFSALVMADSTHFDITSQPLSSGLKAFANQSNMELLYKSAEISGLTGNAVAGDLDRHAALHLLLLNTGLEAVYSSDTAATIRPARVQIQKISTSVNGISPGSSQDANAGSSGSIRLAQANSGQPAPPSAASAPVSSSNGTALDEIVVTAEKRSEKLIEVPTSVSVISGDRLDTLNVASLSDLAGFVPGLSISDGGAPGYRTLELRGLSTGYYPTSGTLVGTYVDGLPVGDSTNAARGGVFGIDINPYDLENVEVLKGPQGTLYGSNTMGGLINYTLRAPNLDGIEAQAGADTSFTEHANSPNWGIRGAFSIPLVPGELALRVSAFDKYSAGYIDNVTLDEQHQNHATEDGGRVSLLFKPLDNLRISASFLSQDSNAANVTAVTLNGYTLQPAYGSRYDISTYFDQPVSQQTRISSLNVDWTTPYFTLTSATGWSHVSTAQASDDTGAYGQYIPAPYTNDLVDFELWMRVSKFVEEVRLVSPDDQPLEWLVGGYFTRETTSVYNIAPSYTPAYVPLATQYQILGPGLPGAGSYKEPAAFADLTYKFNSIFDIGGGVRHSGYSQTGCPGSSTGVFGAPLAPCTALPTQGINTFMGNARLHISPEQTLYARVATGYRPGAGCPTCGNAAQGIPPITNPDRTVNYEIGYKASLLDRHLEVETAIYRVYWSGIQLTEVSAEQGYYTGNGGTATSSGFEGTVTYLVNSDLRIGATLNYTDAHLTQDAPGAFGDNGDTLPGAPRWAASLTADYTKQMSPQWTLLAGASYRYRDAIVNQFDHTPFLGYGGSAPMGPQNIANLYFGAQINAVTIRFRATNVFDNQSYVGLQFLANPALPQYVPIQPRTFGISVDYRLPH